MQAVRHAELKDPLSRAGGPTQHTLPLGQSLARVQATHTGPQQSVAVAGVHWLTAGQQTSGGVHAVVVQSAPMPLSALPSFAAARSVEPSEASDEERWSWEASADGGAALPSTEARHWPPAAAQLFPSGPPPPPVVCPPQESASAARTTQRGRTGQ
jgi:hypothetical protein